MTGERAPPGGDKGLRGGRYSTASMKPRTFFLLGVWVLLLCGPVQAQMGGMPMKATPAHTATPAAPSAAVAALQLSGGWIAAAPPGETQLSAYLTLHNPTSQPVTLVGATSGAAASIMPMLTRRDTAGREYMDAVYGMKILPGGTLKLQPGTGHLMLGGLQRDLRPGEQVTLRLRFADGSQRRVTLTVKRL